MSGVVVMSYSESFKQTVVKEISEGKYTIGQARRVYGIKGGETVRNWIKKYGDAKLLPKVLRIETPNEVRRIKELQKHNVDLEQGLSAAYLKILRLEATLAVAEEKLGYKLEKKTN